MIGECPNVLGGDEVVLQEDVRLPDHICDLCQLYMLLLLETRTYRDKVNYSTSKQRKS